MAKGAKASLVNLASPVQGPAGTTDLRVEVGLKEAMAEAEAVTEEAAEAETVAAPDKVAEDAPAGIAGKKAYSPHSSGVG